MFFFVFLTCVIFYIGNLGTTLSETFCHHKTAHFESNQVTSTEIGLLQANGGNAAINSKYLANYHDDISISQQGMIQFITSKYIKKEWYRKDTNNKGAFNYRCFLSSGYLPFLSSLCVASVYGFFFFSFFLCLFVWGFVFKNLKF